MDTARASGSKTHSLASSIVCLLHKFSWQRVAGPVEPEETELWGQAREVLRRETFLEEGETFAELLERGVDVNCMRAFNDSQQRWRKEHGSCPTAFMLSPLYSFQSRAFPTTLLHMAAVWGNPGAVDALLKHGADPSLPFGTAGHLLRQLEAINQWQQKRQDDGKVRDRDLEWEARVEAEEGHYLIGSVKSRGRCADLIRAHVEAQWDAALPPPAPATPSTRGRF